LFCCDKELDKQNSTQNVNIINVRQKRLLNILLLFKYLILAFSSVMDVWLTARHAIHLQFNISANALERGKSKVYIWCDCTSHALSPKEWQSPLRYSSRRPAVRDTADVTGGKSQHHLIVVHLRSECCYF
jgi:hypothetical protein